MMTLVDFTKTILLSPDNFTPLVRTPWASNHIAKNYKTKFVDSGAHIGESWEFSCDGDFPSKILDSDLTLAEAIAAYPEQILSPRLAQKPADYHQLLVKLIGAGAPLSLQVHPGDAYGGLAPGECGKPESWLILDAKPGAGVYLGFREPIAADILRQRLASGEDCRSWLQFVPVAPGDYFEISPGVPHALGSGITLLEPQRVLPNKKGKTYRLWDWGRKYDDRGYVDQHRGKPRTLHLDDGLALIDGSVQVGASFVASLRRSATLVAAGGVSLACYPENAYYGLVVVTGEAATFNNTLQLADGYLAGVVLAGEVSCDDGRVLPQGQPFVIPACRASWPFGLSQGAKIALSYVQGTNFAINGKSVMGNL